MQQLRRKCGPQLLRFRLLGRNVFVPIEARDVGRLLHQSPESITPANAEKQAALAKFQPHGVLISDGVERFQRRAFNETVLDTDEPLHRIADAVGAAVTLDPFTLRFRDPDAAARAEAGSLAGVREPSDTSGDRHRWRVRGVQGGRQTGVASLISRTVR